MHTHLKAVVLYVLVFLYHLCLYQLEIVVVYPYKTPLEKMLAQQLNRHTHLSFTPLSHTTVTSFFCSDYIALFVSTAQSPRIQPQTSNHYHKFNLTTYTQQSNTSANQS
ncbi:hypothetical protein ABVT39_000484 [Epinephelus coioides]